MFQTRILNTINVLFCCWKENDIVFVQRWKPVNHVAVNVNNVNVNHVAVNVNRNMINRRYRGEGPGLETNNHHQFIVMKIIYRAPHTKHVDITCVCLLNMTVTNGRIPTEMWNHFLQSAEANEWSTV